jgi:hypothetical protein
VDDVAGGATIKTEALSVFTFWEPRGEMSGYLRMCLRTWEQNLPGDSIVVLDYDSLGDHLGADVYDMSILRRLPLSMQKDALMVAILEQHGGVFMDVDTLVLGDLSPVLRPLERSESVMFGMHCGFLAARPHEFAAHGPPEGGLPWDYLAGAALEEVLEGMVTSSDIREPMRARVLGRSAHLAARSTPTVPRRGRLGIGLDRVARGLSKRRLRSVVRSRLAHRLAMLDPGRGGFIPETQHFGSRRMTTRQKYERFWFEDDLDPDEVASRGPVVGLHNSWTPDWYRRLPEDAVLEQDCLLSKTLRRLLVP